MPTDPQPAAPSPTPEEWRIQDEDSVRMHDDKSLCVFNAASAEYIADAHNAAVRVLRIAVERIGRMAFGAEAELEKCQAENARLAEKLAKAEREIHEWWREFRNHEAAETGSPEEKKAWSALHDLSRGSGWCNVPDDYAQKAIEERDRLAARMRELELKFMGGAT